MRVIAKTEGGLWVKSWQHDTTSKRTHKIDAEQRAKEFAWRYHAVGMQVTSHTKDGSMYIHYTKKK